VSHCDISVSPARPLIQGLPRGRQRLDEQRTHFRLEPPPDDHHAVCVRIEAKPSAPMPLRGLPRLGLPVDAPPAADDPLDMGRRARAPDAEEPRFGLRRGHAREGPDLGVGQLPTGEGLGQERQRPQRARDPHPLAGGAQIDPDPPGQPRGAGAEARVPPAPGVELPDQIQEPRGGGVEVRGQERDLVAELVQLRWRMVLHGEPSCATLHRGFRASVQRLGQAFSRRGMIFDSATLESAPTGKYGPAGIFEALPPHQQFAPQKLSSGKARLGGNPAGSVRLRVPSAMGCP
jgi:hypothetical protein